MKIEDAIRYAELWRAGKLVGADEGEVISSLLSEIDDLRALLINIDNEYELTATWNSNGCEHGFKPAVFCPNMKCQVSQLQKDWESLMGESTETKG